MAMVSTWEAFDFELVKQIINVDVILNFLENLEISRVLLQN